MAQVKVENATAVLILFSIGVVTVIIAAFMACEILERVSAEKRFPIQATEYGRVPVTIPWEHAEEAYKEYSARYGTQQSLERLAERHGFGAFEIIDLLVKRIRRIEADAK